MTSAPLNVEAAASLGVDAESLGSESDEAPFTKSDRSTLDLDERPRPVEYRDFPAVSHGSGASSVLQDPLLWEGDQV